MAGQIDVRQPTLEIALSGRTAAMQKDAAPGTDGQQLPQERERERVQNVSWKRSSGFVSFSPSQRGFMHAYKVLHEQIDKNKANRIGIKEVDNNSISYVLNLSIN